MTEMCQQARHHPAAESGATLIETLIILPLFLFLILLVIWYGVSLNERATLDTAVGHGIRLAATRGNTRLVHDEILTSVHTWNGEAIGTSVFTHPKLKELLVFPGTLPDGSPAQWGDVRPILNHDVVGAFEGTLSDLYGGQTPFQKLPPEYIYTIIYIHQTVRQSLGDSVRYPCNPNDPDGAGCLLCSFLNPETFTAQPNLQYNVGHPGEPPPTNLIAVECSYRPATFLLTPLVKMLSMVSPNGYAFSPYTLTVRRRFTFFNGSLD